jgi:tetratricopeptide (TPR) repeat protein
MKLSRILLAALLLLVVPRIANAEEQPRHKFDARDVALIPPAARERFERGEALLEAGDFAGALPLLQGATTEAPDSAIAYRRTCEALTALGRRDEAIAACMSAMTRRGSAMDFRSYVGALTSGSQLLTPEHLSQAVVFARRARELMPDQPWGYAAQCDIAHRLGDSEMLKECVDHLVRVAPEHRETRRALAMSPSASASRLLIGWGALAIASLGTLVHAIGRARRRTLARASALALGCWMAGLVAILPRTAGAHEIAAEAPPPSAAEEPPDLGTPPAPGSFSSWSIDDRDPMSSIPPPEKLHKDPLQFGYLVMDLSERADKATQRGDHAAAIKYWQALAKATPDRSHAFAKMCASYEALGMLPKAVHSCGAALERTGATIKDYLRFVGLVLSKKGELVAEELAVLDKVLEHLKTDDAGKGVVDELACRIGARTRSVARLEPCTAALLAHAPNHPDTVYFQWALAAARGNASEASTFIARAREVSAKPEDILQMEKETQKIAGRWKNHLGIALGLLLSLAAALGLYLLCFRSSKNAKTEGHSSVAV